MKKYANFIFLIRFRSVPTFGRDSIRKFTNNVSELKKLGARDYENLLQVSLAHYLPKIDWFSLSVLHTCLWGASTWTTQQRLTRCSVYSSSLARYSQASTTHRTISWSPAIDHNTARSAIEKFSWYNMQFLWYKRAKPWSYSAGTKGNEKVRHSGHSVFVTRDSFKLKNRLWEAKQSTQPQYL